MAIRETARPPHFQSGFCLVFVLRESNARTCQTNRRDREDEGSHCPIRAERRVDFDFKLNIIFDLQFDFTHLANSWQLPFCRKSLPPSTMSDGSAACAHAAEAENNASIMAVVDIAAVRRARALRVHSCVFSTGQSPMV
jgi:hypothetical protein